MDRTELLPDLYLFRDTCNVYLVRDGDHALAVDFGSGAWLDDLPALGISHLDHVLLTHAHDDQCVGLAARAGGSCSIHAPAGEQSVLAPDRDLRVLPPWWAMGCPANYLPPRRPVPNVTYNIAGHGHMMWRGRRVRFVHTPGHGPNACSILLDHGGRQALCCGDAAHAGGTIWQPFHLEWDHWTGAGALAAWEGVERLRGLSLGLLCPSHGPVVSSGIQPLLRQLSGRLLDFYRAKGQISPGTKDGYLSPTATVAGALQYSPHLYQYGGNGYLLVSDSGTGLVVDPFQPEMPALEALLSELDVRPTAMIVSHYHYDHCDGIPYLRDKYGAEAWLHPLIAEAWQGRGAGPAGGIPVRPLPWLLKREIAPDHLWPERGAWRWEEYDFQVAPWPGQTWWHCVCMATVDGRQVLFAGDNFTPTSKWNGTGGFCAYNGSRFHDGFVPSAQLALDWAPDVVAAGHSNTYAFSATKFRRIIQWAEQAEAAVRALCPSGDLEQDYYVLHKLIAQGGALG
ncbi:MBL fold metallo-hydrolase [bacterium]|nr:MBL fold metallo-hydrolase [bacterium]